MMDGFVPGALHIGQLDTVGHGDERVGGEEVEETAALAAGNGAGSWEQFAR